MSDPDAEQVDPDEVKRRLDAALEAEQAEMDEAESDALAALRGGAEQSRQTHTVDLADGLDGVDPLTVEVIDSIPGRLEQAAASIGGDGSPDSFETVCEIIAHVIQTDGFDNPAVWRSLFDEQGSTVLMTYANNALRPYYERQEQLENARKFRG